MAHRNTLLVEIAIDNVDINADNVAQEWVVTIKLNRLRVACAQADEKTVRTILGFEKGKHLVNQDDGTKQTPLSSALDACQHFNDPGFNIVKQLLEYKADTQHPSVIKSLSKLLFAKLSLSQLTEKDLELIKFILSINNDITNIPNETGKFPLTLAYEGCKKPQDHHAIAILILLENNADIKNITLNNYAIGSDEDHIGLAKMPSPLNKLNKKDKGYYLWSLGIYYGWLITNQKQQKYIYQMYRLFELAAQNQHEPSIAFLLWGNEKSFQSLSYCGLNENLHALYWMEKYFHVNQKKTFEKLASYEKGTKHEEVIYLIIFMTRIRFWLLTPNQPILQKCIDIQHELKKARGIFKEEFKTVALIELYKIKAELIKKTNPSEALAYYRKASVLGDLQAAEWGIDLSRIIDTNELPFFYEKAIEAAKRWNYNELALNLKREQELLPPNAREAKDAKEPKEPKAVAPDQEIEALFNEIDGLVKKERINDFIATRKPLMATELFDKFEVEGCDDIAKEVLQPVLEKSLTSSIIEGKQNFAFLFDSANGLILRKHAIHFLKTQFEQHDKTRYAELLYLECFSPTVPLQPVPEKKQTQLIQIATLYDTLLEEATKKEQWDLGGQYVAKLGQIRGALEKEAGHAPKILEHKEDVVSGFTTAKLKNELDTLFLNIKSSKKEEVTKKIRQFFKRSSELKIEEQTIFKNHFINAILPVLVNGTVFTFGVLFEEKPPLIELRNEIIAKMKSTYKESNDSAKRLFSLAKLEERHCNSTNIALKHKTGSEINDSRQLQIENYFLYVVKGKQEKIIERAVSCLETLSTLNTLPPILLQDAKRKLTIAKYKQYIKKPHDKKTDPHKNEILKYAKENIFQAVYELFDFYSPANGQKRGVNLGFVRIGDSEYIGRRQFLGALYLLLTSELNAAAQKDFPELGSLEGYRNAVINFLSGNKGSEEEKMMARWYTSLTHLILKKLQEPKTDTDRKMLELFTTHPIVFMLKAPEVYGNIETQQEPSVLIRIRKGIEKDMLNAYDDSTWVKEKIAITNALIVKPADLDEKTVNQPAAVQAATPIRRLPTHSASDFQARAKREEAQLPLILQESKVAAVYPTLPAFNPNYSEDEFNDVPIYRKLYQSVLTLLSDQKTEEREPARDYLNSFALKAVGPKTPEFPFYVLATWFNLLINFILDEIKFGIDKSETARLLHINPSQFLKCSVKTYRENPTIAAALKACGITEIDFQQHIVKGIEKCEAAYAATPSTFRIDKVVKAPMSNGPGNFSIFAEGVSSHLTIARPAPAILPFEPTLHGADSQPHLNAADTPVTHGAGVGTLAGTSVQIEDDLMKFFESGECRF